MKKILSLVLALAVLTTVCFTLASCGKKISGTYVNESYVSTITYEFEGNKVTVTDTVHLGTSTYDITYSGNYEITKDKESGDLKITFTFEEDDAVNYNKTCTFEETDDGIKLNGLTYKKQ